MEPEWGEAELRARLDPVAMSSRLIRASILITAYELLKSRIVDPIRDFLAEEWTRDGAIESTTYRMDVLSKGGHVKGSIAWLVAQKVITPDQAEAFDRLWTERHRLAHEMAAILVDPTAEVDSALIGEAISLSQSLDDFWGAVAVDTNPQFDGEHIDYAGIRSGVSLLLEHFGALSALADELIQAAANEPQD